MTKDCHFKWSSDPRPVFLLTEAVPVNIASKLVLFPSHIFHTNKFE